jgi:hypothetical protein
MYLNYGTCFRASSFILILISYTINCIRVYEKKKISEFVIHNRPYKTSPLHYHICGLSRAYLKIILNGLPLMYIRRFRRRGFTNYFQCSQLLLTATYLNMVERWKCRPGSSVGIATGYGLDGPGIESRWGAKFSAPVQNDSGAHPASCTGSFSGVESGGGVTLTTHPF